MSGFILKKGNRGKWFFLFAFIFSCFLFWWLRSLLIRFVFHIEDPVEDSTIAISVLALLFFIVGYLFPAFGFPSRQFTEDTLDACGKFAYDATKLIAIPALAIAIQIWFSWVDKASSSGLPRVWIYQAVLYTHLFFGYMFFGAADPQKQGWRRIWTAAILVTLPRLIISLHGGRFFLAQAVVPAVLIVVARGWIRISGKRILQFSALALFIIFVPAITRGDVLIGPDDELQIFMGSNVLGLFQNNTGLSLTENCPPLLISLTAKVIPYGALGVCVVDIGGLKDMPATLERILTNNEPGSFHGTASGTGSDYLLELYLTGGLFAVYAGSALFGFSCRRFVGWIGKRSLFSGIWAECLTRALLAPRGNLGYVYERIPSLVLATMFVIIVVWVGHLLKREHVGRPVEGISA
jgi:hypothetical protein